MLIQLFALPPLPSPLACTWINSVSPGPLASRSGRMSRSSRLPEARGAGRVRCYRKCGASYASRNVAISEPGGGTRYRVRGMVGTATVGVGHVTEWHRCSVNARKANGAGLGKHDVPPHAYPRLWWRVRSSVCGFARPWLGRDGAAAEAGAYYRGGRDAAARPKSRSGKHRALHARERAGKAGPR
jgi:hypothetical protein